MTPSLLTFRLPFNFLFNYYYFFFYKKKRGGIVKKKQKDIALHGKEDDKVGKELEEKEKGYMVPCCSG